MAHVLIVGAGPAGAALAYLLARRDIEVTLLERQTDFARVFRGEGLQPSGIDAFGQMGLGDAFDALPHCLFDAIQFIATHSRCSGSSWPVAGPGGSRSRRRSRCWSSTPQRAGPSPSCAVHEYTT